MIEPIGVLNDSAVPTVYENTKLTWLETVNKCIEKVNDMIAVINSGNLDATVLAMLQTWVTDGTFETMINTGLSDRVSYIEGFMNDLVDSTQTVADDGEYFSATTLVTILQEIGAALTNISTIGDELAAIQAMPDTAGYLYKSGAATYELDARNLAEQLIMQSLTGATAGWYRIAESIEGVGSCFGRFTIDWSQASYFGNIMFIASSMNNFVSTDTVKLDMLHCAYFGAGIQRARIVYRANTYTGEKCYLELYLTTPITISPLNVILENNTGWVLTDPIVPGSVPSNYTQKAMIFSSLQALGSTSEMAVYSGTDGLAYPVWNKGNFALNNRNHNTSESYKGQDIISGWDYGSPATNALTFDLAVLYPVQMAATPACIVCTGGGAKLKASGDPAGLDDASTTTGYSITVIDPTNTGFTARFERASNFLATYNYVFSWMALGLLYGA